MHRKLDAYSGYGIRCNSPAKKVVSLDISLIKKYFRKNKNKEQKRGKGRRKYLFTVTNVGLREWERKKDHKGRKEEINLKNNKLVHQHFDDKLVMLGQLPNWQIFLLTFKSSLATSAEMLDFTDQTNGRTNMSTFLYI